MRDTIDRPNPLKTLFGRMLQRARSEPVALQGLVQAGLGMMAGFGVVAWTTEQVGLVMAFTAAILALFTRHQVRPTAKQVSDPPPDAKPASPDLAVVET